MDINNNHKYLFKVRRSKVDDTIFFRNFLDDFLYSYSIINIDKNSSLLKLKAKTIKIVKSNKNLHIIWSIIDPKIIEKSIPFLNSARADRSITGNLVKNSI